MDTRQQKNLCDPAGLGWRPPVEFNGTFTTPRLLVRPLALDDAHELFDLISSTREHLIPWLSFAKTGHRTITETMAFITSSRLLVEKPETILDRKNPVTLAVTRRDTGRIIGSTGVHDVRPETANAETGYWIAKDHTRQGFGTEACRHTISWAFRAQTQGGLGLRRLRAFCSDQNEPSRRLLDSLGIRREVDQRDDYWVDGFGPTTRLGWGVMADEWDGEHHRSLITSNRAHTGR